MSNRNPNVDNHSVIPVFSPVNTTDVFSNTDARFAVGQIAQSVLTDMPRNGYEAKTKALAKFPGRVINGFADAVHNYGLLRANVYIDQTRMLPEEVRNSRGEEWDLDDARSDHFITLERLYADDPLVRDIVEKNDIEPDSNGFVLRLLNCMRIIKKTEMHPTPLPIEEFFPDATNPETGELVFPATFGSIELSRKIAVQEEPRTSRMLSMPMFSTTTKHTLENGLGPAYATVEDFYEAVFRNMRLPMKRIAEPRYVGEYADDNLGIEIDRFELAKMLGLTVTRAELKTTQPFTLYGMIPSHDIAA